uniref:Uncharacterized protein n=1 Tax=Melanopsichium pennsylvanicum 4 TaxID=1398559 RepID=A0A077RCA2_9BASI|nr:uncharacterized protein BN887_06184 [Melanopsichium pennsylvanicum 4]
MTSRPVDKCPMWHGGPSTGNNRAFLGCVKDREPGRESHSYNPVKNDDMHPTMITDTKDCDELEDHDGGLHQ